MQPDHRYLSNLTPLRGFAAVWVVVYHFSEIVTHFVSGDRSQIINKGYLMVDLFFILSGFIITHVYQQSFSKHLSGQKFKEFIVARFARIYPLHFFTLMALIVMAASRHEWNVVQFPAAIPTNLLLIHSFGIHSIFTWNVPSWSISAEWWAYMVFPFLILFLNRKGTVAIISLLLFVVLAYLSIMFWIPRVNIFNPGAPPRINLDVTFDYGFLRGLAGFISGMLLYKLYETQMLKRLFSKDWVAGLVMLAAMLSMHVGLNDGITMILFAAIVFAYTWNNGALHRVCNLGILQYIGKISYSIYLVQLFTFIPVFAGMIRLPGLVDMKDYNMTTFWNGAFFCLLFLLAVLALASLTYYTIEKPCRKWINAHWGRERMPVYA